MAKPNTLFFSRLNVHAITFLAVKRDNIYDSMKTLSLEGVADLADRMAVEAIGLDTTDPKCKMTGREGAVLFTFEIPLSQITIEQNDQLSVIRGFILRGSATVSGSGVKRFADALSDVIRGPAPETRREAVKNALQGLARDIRANPANYHIERGKAN